MRLGFFTTFNALIDESQKHAYVNNRNCARSRQLLLIMWLVAGFFVSNFYKSNLRSMLINTVYEKPIDTVDDFINAGISKMPVGEPVMHLFEGDKRENVQRMAERVYEFEFPGYFPEWLADGQVSLT